MALGIVADLRGEPARFLGREATRLVDQRQLGLFFFGRGQYFSFLNLDLVLIQLTRALDGKPLAQRHGERACQQAGEARDQNGAVAQLGARHTHYQAEIGYQSIIRAQHSGPECIASTCTVPSLQLRQFHAVHATLHGASRMLQQAGVRALIRGHVGRARRSVVFP